MSESVMNTDMERWMPYKKTQDTMWHPYRKPYKYPTICQAGQQPAEKGEDK
ncbi:MAG: hypothetical protein PHQ72_14720 [Hespellia sp.]|nr:hypothetical protein [Hespellia sp.]